MHEKNERAFWFRRRGKVENASHWGHRCCTAQAAFLGHVSVPPFLSRDGRIEGAEARPSWDIAGVGAIRHRAGMVAHSPGLAERTQVIKMAQDDRDAQTN